MLLLQERDNSSTTTPNSREDWHKKQATSTTVKKVATWVNRRPCRLGWGEFFRLSSGLEKNMKKKSRKFYDLVGRTTAEGSVTLFNKWMNEVWSFVYQTRFTLHCRPSLLLVFTLTTDWMKTTVEKNIFVFSKPVL